MTCEHNTCERDAYSRGWCLMHYKRWWRTGSIYTVRRMSEQFTLRERFEAKGWTVTEEGCWNWNGRIVAGGYGQLDYGGTALIATRVSYTLHKGEIPKGLMVCHTCDNRRCVNPDHLWLGTNQDNMDDMVAKGRSGPRPRGEDNLKTTLTEDQVRELRLLRSEGMLLRVLAERYGITEASVSMIARRRTWAWLD